MRKSILTLILLCSFLLSWGQINFKNSLFLAIEKNDTVAMRSLIRNGNSANQVHQAGFVKITPLLYAIQKGKAAAVKVLIDEKADLDWLDVFSTTGLMYAANSGNEELVKLLLDNNANPMVKDKQGHDALSAARDSKNLRVIELVETAQKRRQR